MIPLIAISCYIGLVISLYFTAIYKGWMKGISFLVPKEVCSKNTCVEILKTKFAHLFVIPNFYLGIIYYLFILISLQIFLPFPDLILYAILVIVWFVVLISVYLAYSLIFILKTNCTLCFASHLLNIVIAIGMTWVYFNPVVILLG